MVDFAISESRVICGGSNEGFTGELGKTARGDAARKERQRELKEKLVEVRIPAVLLLSPAFSLPKIRVPVNLNRAAGRFCWTALMTGFQGPLNT